MEITTGKISPSTRTSLLKEDIWKLPTGIRNAYFSKQFFKKQADKSNNRATHTDVVDAGLKVPNFVKTGSFEGLALKSRPF